MPAVIDRSLYSVSVLPAVALDVLISLMSFAIRSPPRAVEVLPLLAILRWSLCLSGSRSF